MPAVPQSDIPYAGATDLERFIARLRASVAGDEFARLVLAKPAQGSNDELRSVQARRIALRGQDELSLVYRYRTRDVTKNLPVPAALDELAALLGPVFLHAHLHTLQEDITLLIGKRGRPKLLVAAPQARQAPPPREHDRHKQRWVAQDAPFLQALGVTDAQHRVIPAMARKWRQINKFVEVFDAAWRDCAPQRGNPRVVDFGSGKGYLTFALHHHLRRTLGLNAQVTGVELRADMMQLCSATAQRLQLEGLSFEQGDVRQRVPRPLDVVIALHACDTATDHAIRLGVEGGAQIILCAPCCHKEVRPQLLSPQPIRAVLRHGVHLGQEADMVTDALRALLLEASGYATQVFEFVALEHTSKNKMILAVKRPHAADPAPWLEQVAQLKQFYGIREQALERLLAPRLVGA
jgi:SAM-dependent methyltransferase